MPTFLYNQISQYILMFYIKYNLRGKIIIYKKTILPRNGKKTHSYRLCIKSESSHFSSTHYKYKSTYYTLVLDDEKYSNQ